MEYCSSYNDGDFILEFSDDECSNRMDHADNYSNNDDIQRDSKRCESSQLKYSFAQLKQENYYELNYVKFSRIVEKENGIFNDDGNEQKFASQYLTTSAVSPEKRQVISQNFEKDNISDKMVDFSKLLNQILNARVVIERMCEYSGMNEQSAKNRALPCKSLFKDSVKLYCPKCQTVTVDAHRLYEKKSCSKCESTLKYMCSKCNDKHYNTYENLIRHSHACGLADCTLEKLKPSNFIVKKTEIDYSKEIIRYCSRCHEDDRSCEKWPKRLCRYCHLQLLYQCNKCKTQYKTSSSLIYHMHSKCYPSQYKCNQCVFMCSVWENMRQHVISVHLRAHFIIEPPTRVLDAKAVLRKSKAPPAEDKLSRTVGNHTNVDLFDEKELEGKTNCNEYGQLYCPTCKKTKFARIKDVLAKNCSGCKTAMTFLCTKCNVKHYKRYRYLLLHLDRCKWSVDVTNNFEGDIERTKPNMEDKNEANLFLDRSKFIAKEFQPVNNAEKWSRHCPKCGLEIASNDRCCCEKLFYVCKKCDVKCSSYEKMAYHAENYCFPTCQYKCTHCELSKTSWKKMKTHFNIMHGNLPLIKCEFCSYETKLKSNMRVHLGRRHHEIDKIFQCGNCSYSTHFERNLHRHKKLNH